MPLVAKTMETALLPMFKAMPVDQKIAGLMFATAYVAYASISAPNAPSQLNALADDAAKAFDPGAPVGAAKLMLAFVKFWAPMICIPVNQLAIAPAIFTPIGDTSLILHVDDATPEQQAQALANALHTLTLASVKVTLGPPTGGTVPIT